MLKYSVARVNRLMMPDEGQMPNPFPGKYPTRLYCMYHGRMYLGKPTPNAWTILRRWKGNRGMPDFIEFDKSSIVRQIRGGRLSVSFLARRYYVADTVDLRGLAAADYAKFAPMRLREGSIYFADSWKMRYPTMTQDRWYQVARMRIRGDKTELFAAWRAQEDNRMLREMGIGRQHEEPVRPGGELLAAFNQLLQLDGNMPAPPRAGRAPRAVAPPQPAVVGNWNWLAPNIRQVGAAVPAQWALVNAIGPEPDVPEPPEPEPPRDAFFDLEAQPAPMPIAEGRDIRFVNYYAPDVLDGNL